MFTKKQFENKVGDILLMRFSGQIGIGLMFFVILVGFGFTTMAPYFATQQLAAKIEDDTDELVQTYIKNIVEYKLYIEKLSQDIEFSCSETEQARLRDIAFEQYLVKKITVIPNNSEGCASFSSSNEPAFDAVTKIKNYNDAMSLWVSSQKDTLQRMFEIRWKNEKGQLIVAFEPIVEEILRNKYCENCLFTFVSTGTETTTLAWEKNISRYEATPIHEVLLANGLRLSSYIKPELLDSTAQSLRMPLFLIGISIAMLLILMRRAFIRRRLSLHSLVQRGILKREFVPYYQPIVNVKTKELYGCEVLARWKKKTGLISPMEFIPYVEKSGQIIPITNLLIEKTIKDLSVLNWQLTNRVISINLVPQQLENRELINDALQLFTQSNISVKQVAFEITERKQFEDLALASEVIDYLKSQGIDIKLDDAGTGYGGFSYIQQLNLRSLKIDKMFVENIGTTDIKLSLLDSIIAFGKQAGMEMIAEGVETKAQSDYLVERDVYLQQGYYFGMPMDAEEFSLYNREIKKRSCIIAP